DCTMLWHEWWTYEGISGPDYWGTHNPAWSLCNKGKYQSPIDVSPNKLIYDPNLKPLHIDNTKVDGTLLNTGHDVTYEVLQDSLEPPFTFSGGPLSYKYRVQRIKLHFGVADDIGSEHTVAGKTFPIEIQIIGYNSDLYKNYTEALFSTHGLAAFSILGMLDDKGNEEFETIVKAARIIHLKKALSRNISSFSIHNMIPKSDFFITYEGSLTQPSCQETVTWILMNRPLHVSQEQLKELRLLYSSENTPLMENNFRTPMPVNRRPVRTNINPKAEDKECTFKRTIYYK
ncbi:hypothetical protein ACJMK2_031778, partial [Sinanodonta woodiana]